jgi:hypothetical protein
VAKKVTAKVGSIHAIHRNVILAQTALFSVGNVLANAQKAVGNAEKALAKAYKALDRAEVAIRANKKAQS